MSKGYLITACESVKKPIFSEVKIMGLGTFSELASNMAEHILGEFKDRGYIVSSVGYGAIHTHDGKQIYFNKEREEYSRPHETFHELVRSAKIRSVNLKDPAKGYFAMFEESAAMAVSEYALLKEGTEELLKSVETKRKFGRETYELVNNALTSGNITEEEINELSQTTIPYHTAKNWASMLVDLTYFGFLDPVLSILERQGNEKGQETLVSILKTIEDDPTADKFFESLQSESGKKLERIPPIREGIVIKGLFQYKGGEEDEDNYIRSIFSGPKKENDIEKCDFFPAMKNSFLARYGPELDKIGTLWMNAWGNEIIFNGFE